MREIEDNRAIIAVLSFIFATAVVITLGAFTFYEKAPWYLCFLSAVVVYPSAILMVWGDEVVNIIKTIVDSIFKKKEG